MGDIMLTVSKYHGCGNDFLLTEDACYDEAQKRHMSAVLCDRHTGIGADGMIFVRSNPLTMEIYNSDGSFAPMCGNGIRCFAKYVLEKKLVYGNDFEVQTAVGIKQLHVHNKDPFYVSVNMGKACFQCEQMQIRNHQLIKDYPLQIQDHTLFITSVFMTTLHTVIFIEKNDCCSFAEIGAAVHTHPLFLAKTNVDFVEIIDKRNIRVTTYERGVGMTFACGSGCCAAVWVAWMANKVERDVNVHLKKGALRIQISEDEQLVMSGGADKIMEAKPAKALLDQSCCE